MISSIADLPFADSPVFTGDRLASLAQTYDRVDRPIWVHDLSNRCVYYNQAARQVSKEKQDASFHVFEIFDHGGRIIGRLTTDTG